MSETEEDKIAAVPVDKQKWIFRLFVTFAVLLFLGVFFYAFQLTVNDTTGDLRQAPFDYKMAHEDAATIDLSNPQVTTRQLEMDVAETVADVLSFDSKNYASRTRAAKTNFTEDGYTQYMGYLTSSNITGSLAERDLQCGAYTEGSPLLLNNGVVDGVYKWLFEVPVTLSFIPRVTSYDGNGRVDALNRRILVRVQVTRVYDGANPMALRIESWQVLPARS